MENVKRVMQENRYAKKDDLLSNAGLYANSSDLNYAPVGSNLRWLACASTDSLTLGYLRRIHCVSRATGGKSLSLQKAEKDSHECDCL